MSKAIERRMTLRDQVTPTMSKINKSTLRYKKNLRDLKKSGSSAFGSLTSKITGLVAAYASLATAKETFNLSENLVSINSRLNLMNDGLQTTAELQNMIYASAQRARTSYTDTAAVVSKLGILAKDAFSNNKEMIFFVEQMNKQFKIGGSSIQEQTAAMYQLTQAMAAGRLQGDEFRSIMENAPMLAQAIAKEMGKSVGELKEMSSEGLITSDIIKRALFASADETNKKFAELPMTIGQVWTQIKNSAVNALSPALTQINTGFSKVLQDNLPAIQAKVTAVANTLITWVEGGGIQNFIDKLSTAVTVVRDFLPLIASVAGAFAAYKVTVAAMTIVQGVYNAAMIAYKLIAGKATAAQLGLNAAMLANPVGLVVAGIVLLIGVVVMLIKHWDAVKVAMAKAWNTVVEAAQWAVNKYIGFNNLILSGYKFLGESIAYIFTRVWNVVVSGAESAVKSVLSPVNAIRKALGMETIKVNFSAVKSKMEKPKFAVQEIIPKVNFDKAKFSDDTIAALEAARDSKKKKDSSLESKLDDLKKSIDYNTDATTQNTGALKAKSSDLTGEEIADKLLPRLERYVYT